jgi:hypothetical protein
LNGRLLLEAKARIHGATGVHQQSEPKRQVTLMPERVNFRNRLAIIFDANILLHEILDEAMPVGSSKENGHLVHSLADSPGIRADSKRGQCPGLPNTWIFFQALLAGLETLAERPR